MEPERRRALDWLREWGEALEREVDLLYNPPGAHFSPRFGLPPRVGCKGTTRDGRPCAAHAAIIGGGTIADSFLARDGGRAG